MSLYYVVSQLPSLDGLQAGTPPPITEARFFELCEGSVSPRVVKALQGMSLCPPREKKETGYAFLDRWYEVERQLRLALGAVRANRQKKEFDLGWENIPASLMQAAKTAVEIDNPMVAEQYLNSQRFVALETLRPLDGFCEDAIFYYAVKLKLIWRIHQFDVEAGRTAYRNIYRSMIGGEKGGEK